MPPEGSLLIFNWEPVCVTCSWLDWTLSHILGAICPRCSHLANSMPDIWKHIELISIWNHEHAFWTIQCIYCSFYKSLVLPVDGDVVAATVQDFDNKCVSITELQCGPRILTVNGEYIVDSAQSVLWSLLYLFQERSHLDPNWNDKWEEQKKKIEYDIQQSCGGESLHLQKNLSKLVVRTEGLRRSSCTSALHSRYKPPSSCLHPSPFCCVKPRVLFELTLHYRIVIYTELRA